MNKTEYREHCKKQIERCIKLNDTKHLREHELSLSLLNECEERKQEKDSLIKHLEDKINTLQIQYHESAETVSVLDKGMVLGCIGGYQDILERLKSGKYE